MRGISVSLSSALTSCVRSTGSPQVLAVTAQVYAGQNNFLVTGQPQIVDFAHKFADRSAAARPARDRSDAEGAGIVAAILRLDEGARPTE